MFYFDNDDDDGDVQSPCSVGCLFWSFLLKILEQNVLNPAPEITCFFHFLALLWLGDWLKKTRATFIVDAKSKPIVIYS